MLLRLLRPDPTGERDHTQTKGGGSNDPGLPESERRNAICSSLAVDAGKAMNGVLVLLAKVGR